jgi:histidinol dehydrogenase
MRLVDLRGTVLDSALVNSSVPRAPLDIDAALAQIRPLLADIGARGLEPILEAARKFDNLDPTPLRVQAHELVDALESLSAELRLAIEQSISRVRAVSKATLPAAVTVELAEGAKVHQRWQAVDSVGLYVPGGKAVYPSSVIMNVVPAQVAGVKRLAIATPAQIDFGSRPHPVVLATAALLGITEVYAIGGPAAIGALAYGVEQIGLKPVAMVTGPGNIFVAAAKRGLRGVIGIDSEAGTTEILVLADASADARLIAYDLVSQAEHDEAAACVVVSDSESLLTDVEQWVGKIAEQTANSGRVVQALGGVQSALVLVDSQEQARAFADGYATEHLEIHTQNPSADAALITNAGAIFLGPNSPVSLGDYIAGSNHVLPTGQQAKFGAGLGVHTFLRAQQLIDYDRDALAEVADLARIFANSEGLPAHGEAISARFD